MTITAAGPYLRPLFCTLTPTRYPLLPLLLLDPHPFRPLRCWQAISMRAAAYEFLWRNTSTHGAVFMPDGLHPAWLGHLLWADIMIYTFKKVTCATPSAKVWAWP